VATDISNAGVIGYYAISNYPYYPYIMGFVENNGVYTDINDTNVSGLYGTFPLAINDSGAIVGYVGLYNIKAAFLDVNGTITTLHDPSVPVGDSYSEEAIDISNNGQVLGQYQDFTTGKIQYYVFNYTTGEYTDLNGPSGASSFTPKGITSDGVYG